MNPFKHLDPLGTLMIMLTLLAGFGIGWGKPVPLDPKRMRNPRWDHFWAVAAGPISNLLQAAAYALVMRLFLMYGLFQESELVWYVLRVGITVNLALCFFNLIPLGPLDGQWLVGAFLSEKTRYGWYRWNLQVGGFLLLMLIFVGQFNQNFDIIGNVVRPLVSQVASFLLGIKVV
jgi:Zn-dependent protease